MSGGGWSAVVPGVLHTTAERVGRAGLAAALLNAQAASTPAATTADPANDDTHLAVLLRATEQLAGLRDPAHIESTLLRNLAALLAADRLFLDRGGCCTRLAVVDRPARATGDAAAVRSALAPLIETVRRDGGALALPPTPALAAAHGLLGALAPPGGEPGVVIALRSAAGRPFQSADVVAARALLGYGAQVLGHAALVRDLQRGALDTVCALVNAIDAKDNYTSDHSERVGSLARLTGQALGLPRERLQALEWAGLLHDVGKIGIAEQILNKPGKLTDSEFAQMKNHPRIGREMLRPVARFEPVLEAVLYHHENHDGSGYPDGLPGGRIPLEARIIHVVDIFDALTTRRPYRRRYDLEHALRLMRLDAGHVTDPHVMEAFTGALRRHAASEPDAFRARYGHLIQP